MSARDQVPVETPRDLVEQHDMRIHRAKQKCRPVLYRGLKYFIAGFCWHKGDEEMIVYLEGIAGPVRPCDITVLEN
ncbi:hypothetical protein [Duganella violaceipulchra]|uniref:Uncharacterized protein n=1 Tax=Duganella violaceipulchra TaxID=2849652 RepID=A0AA41L284_9BURK|nr:hypothetical protein [Duganella violaceicalia]MBV6321973.1 hypothetical protein [Duganella violaceicalia]MCP2007030.1 hypothetical protein [Duganella violaceicalia]